MEILLELKIDLYSNGEVPGNNNFSIIARYIE